MAGQQQLAIQIASYIKMINIIVSAITKYLAT